MFSAIFGILPFLKWLIPLILATVLAAYLLPPVAAFLKPVSEALGKLTGWLIDIVRRGGQHLVKSAPALILATLIGLTGYGLGKVHGYSVSEKKVMEQLHKDYKFIPKTKSSWFKK